MQVRLVQGSILEVDVQAIVNAANSRGIMGGGVAAVIKRAAGPEVDEEAQRQAPIPVGSAVLTSGGRTRYQAIIHAPTDRKSTRLNSSHANISYAVFCLKKKKKKRIKLATHEHSNIT